jgi:hypothetical protein
MTENSRGSVPLRFRHIFVITYGRSGSTLLNGVLNSIPGVCIRGENANTLFHLYRAIDAATRATGHRGTPDIPTRPWYGANLIDPDALRAKVLDAFRKHIIDPPDGAVAVGFKEIRYTLANMSDVQFDGYIDFLLGAFDCTCVIFNVRRWQEVANSAWWVANPFTRFFVRSCDARFERNLRRHPDCTFKVDYDRYKTAPEALQPLFEFLGVEFDREAVARVLAVRHSYSVLLENLEQNRQSRSVVIGGLEALANSLRKNRNG